MENKNVGILDPDGLNLNPLTKEPYSETYREYAKVWKKFPAYSKANEIIEAINKNQIILITSGTGSGKTVLLPKYMLHVFNYEKKIAVTLPKQMIAQSAAEYASLTLDVKLGDHVGYKFKGAPKNSMKDSTKLLFATDGTIVAKLLKDPKLEEYSGILIDEAHERKIQIDFLLYLLKNTCKLRPEFKVVIMSATVNEFVFVDYFKEFKFTHFDVGGETNYPIESIFLKEPINSKMYIEEGLKIIKKISSETDSGDILFFVTSIQETFDACTNVLTNNNNSFCIEIYAGMNKDLQELAQTINKSNKRKILIGTNVAESSLTINNIKYVIDSGYELFNYYDPKTRAKVLTKQFITHAQAKQRMGRAGRTGPGICYHLYTKKEFENMQKYPLPSINVSNITSECLKLLSLNTINTVDNLKNVLNEFIEPPNKKYVNDAIKTLEKMKLVENNKITDLGKFISDLQLEPEQGLTIYNAYKLGCVKEVIAIIAMIEASKGNINELFKTPKTNETSENSSNNQLLKKYTKAKENLINNKNSDHLALLSIFNKYKKTKNADWLHKNFLKESVLNKAIKNYQKIKQIAMEKLKNYVKNNANWKILEKHKLSSRIVASFLSGYFLNVTNLKKNNLKISKDSFLNFNNNKSELELKKILYNEMITIENNTNLSIVSKISKSHIELQKML